MDKNKKAILINFKKTKSMAEKLINMLENKDYCIDIMQQNLATIGLLKSAHQMLMENHLQSCFKNAMASKNDKLKKQMVTEILKVNKMVNK
jgi:DNA-binding FrmR family transcriptional regulator